jgi:hypothetical protein
MSMTSTNRTLRLGSALERSGLSRSTLYRRRGFTVDAEITPAVGGRRWMRIIGAPVCRGTKARRLHGIKITSDPPSLYALRARRPWIQCAMIGIGIGVSKISPASPPSLHRT